MINEDLKNKIKQVGGARGARQNVQEGWEIEYAKNWRPFHASADLSS
jgi:hypothetical protein